MKKSLGLVEVAGLCAAVYTADAMVKAANVELVALERARGNGWMTVKVTGDVGAVKAAVSVGVQTASSNGKLIASWVIARPTDEVDQAFVENDLKNRQAAAEKIAAEKAAVEKAAAEKAAAEKAAAEKAAAEKAAAEEQINEEKSGSQTVGAVDGKPAVHTQAKAASKAAVLPKNNTATRRTKKKKN